MTLAVKSSLVDSDLGTSTEATDAHAWASFEDRLADVLSRMAVDQFFTVSTLPAGDESIFYVQFAQGGPAGLLAEAVSNAYLMGGSQLNPAQEQTMLALGWQAPTPRSKVPENYNRQWPMTAPFPEVASLAVRTLREVYGVGGPADLVYRRFSRHGGDFAEPNLGIDPERPTTPRGARGPAVPGAEELRELIASTLRLIADGEAVLSTDDRSQRIAIGGIGVDVAVLDGDPAFVRAWAPIMPARLSPELLGALNDLNTELVVTRVLHSNGVVFASSELLVSGVRSEAIASTCRAVAATAVIARTRLGSLADRDPSTERLN